MPDAVVTATRARWVEDGQAHSAKHGETIAVSDKEFKRLEALGVVAKAGKSGGSDGGWPGTHDQLDALAEEHGVEFSSAKLKVADKVAELELAGVAEPAAADED